MTTTIPYPCPSKCMYKCFHFSFQNRTEGFRNWIISQYLHYRVFVKKFYDAHHVASFVFQRFAPTAAAFQGAMYVVGGFNGKDYLR